ncbi:MAG: response regulator [Lysobacterales bacterium]
MPDPILLAEDDPIALEVLASHLRVLELPYREFSSFREVAQALQEQRYAALILDLNLRGGNSVVLLQAIRADRGSPSHDSPALAISAELRPELRQQLQAAGFSAALQKPICLDDLRSALAAAGLPVGVARYAEPTTAPAIDLPVLDDAAAVTACGSLAVVGGLRSLFAAELPDHVLLLRSALSDGDRERWQDTLHRLRSALGFCGGAELLARLSTLPDGLPTPEQMAPIWVALERLSRALPRAARLPRT